MALGSGVGESHANEGLASSAGTGGDDVAPPQGESSLRNLLLLAGLLVVAFGFAFAAGNAANRTGSSSPSQAAQNPPVTAATPGGVTVPARPVRARKVTPKTRVIRHASAKPVVRSNRGIARSTKTRGDSHASAGVSKGTASPSTRAQAIRTPAAAPEPTSAPAPTPAPVYRAPPARPAPSSGNRFVSASGGSGKHGGGGRRGGTGIVSGSG